MISRLSVMLLIIYVLWVSVMFLFGCLLIKVVCELGLECREIVWFLFYVGVGDLRGFVFSMRGLGWMNFWCISCCVNGVAG